MKKRAKIITILALICCCFLICSCGSSAKPSTSGSDVGNSGSDVENSDSTPIESDSSQDSSKDENGGNWTDEMPLN